MQNESNIIISTLLLETSINITGVFKWIAANARQQRNFYKKVHVDMLQRTTFDSADTVFVSVWDYAGDEDFTATHHIFLSTDAVYIITFNAERLYSNTVENIGKCFKIRKIENLPIDIRRKSLENCDRLWKIGFIIPGGWL